MARSSRLGWRRAVSAYEAALRALPLLYGVWAILVGSTIAWVMPPWQNADEGAHVERAIQISLGGLLGRRLGHNAGGLSDPAVDISTRELGPIEFHGDRKVSATTLRAAAAVFGSPPAIRGFDNTATYPPLLYAPAVPAVWIGRFLRLPITLTLRLIRMFDLVAAAGLGALAVATARRLRLAIVAVLLLPMSIALAASASQDALLIPLAAWVAAAIDRARAEPARADGWAGPLAIAAGLLAVLLARPPYLPLAALLLLPAAAGRPLPAGRARPVAVALAAGTATATVLWAGFVAWRISVPMNVADPARQAALLLRHPLAFGAALGETLGRQAGRYAAGVIGNFGWLDTPLPTGFVQAAEAVLVLALLSAAGPEAHRSVWWRQRSVLGLAAVLAASCSVFVSIYIIWSAPGAPTIEGIQGRYFLPLLPALALAMPNLGRWTAALRPAALGAVLLLAAVGPAVTITTLIDRYYLMP